jgi:hypothetical protein
VKRQAPLCINCDKPMRSVPATMRGEPGWRGWGYGAQGLFCSMRCAADWGNAKAQGTSYDYDDPRGEIDNGPFRVERNESR